MTPRSLRLRLLLGAAVWIGLALLLAGVAITAIFAANVEQRIRLDLEARFTRLAAEIDPATYDLAPVDPLQDPRYRTPFGGLYWQVTDLATGAAATSVSLWDFQLLMPEAALGDGEPHYAVIDGPSDQRLTALARMIRFGDDEDARQFLVIVAEDRASLAASIRQFGSALALALLVVGLVLIAAAWLQVHLGLRPLKTLRAGIERIRAGSAENLAGAFPSEVQPLAVEVNDLLRSQEESIAFARARASDLAHGLKTPLSVLATVSSSLAARGDAETARLVDELTTEMAGKVDHQLRLSRLRMRTATHLYSASLNEALARTIGVLKRTEAGEVLTWDTAFAEGLRVDLDPQDLIELLGVVLENAAKWARTRVVVRATKDEGAILLAIEDDGPGLPADVRQTIGQRGLRHDETKAGTGLGLAIAREIVHLNKGTISFGEAPAGGLGVKITLPLAP
ncbi:MAG: HAMP domain-containing histidine kinase [Bauldia sp.]|nr:HAMP domain-containing histidine kinase [Bauldia sp.]